MNTADYCFKVADRTDKCGTGVFYIVLIVSAVLAVHDSPLTTAICHPCLIAATALAILCTVITTIYQTDGNCALRATQLSNALGAGVGESIRSDYYNNNVPQSLNKLAATTLENTLFTKMVISKMAVKMRFMVVMYFLLLLILSTCRGIPTTWLVVLAQTLFSADLLLKLVRLERFRVRTVKVYNQLEQFFLQLGGTEKPNDLAVLIVAFTNYECAKDEAAMPLETKYFKKFNAELSQSWIELKNRLHLQ